MTPQAKQFSVSGKIRLSGQEQPFSKTVTADNEKHAMTLALALLGSQNKLVRRDILIEQTKIVK